MKLPQIENAHRYTGLYVVDFGNHCGIGFTATEVVRLVESEKFAHIGIYKIHNARPDGTIELRAIRREIFDLESGMFFHASDNDIATDDYCRLVAMADKIPAPARAKVHLAQYPDAGFVTAVIYPAEYEDEFSRWLLDGGYRTNGTAEGGSGAVQRYYTANPQILMQQQLFGSQGLQSRSGEELFESAKKVMQR